MTKNLRRAQRQIFTLGDQLKPDLLKLNKALSVATEAEAERLAAE